MSPRSKPNQQTDGEVVYRRVVSADQLPDKPTLRSRLDPASAPLVAGFALLLLLILVLGNLSVRRIEDTSSKVLDLGNSFAARSQLLLEVRVALTKLDTEARDRVGAD